MMKRHCSRNSSPFLCDTVCIVLGFLRITESCVVASVSKAWNTQHHHALTRRLRRRVVIGPKSWCDDCDTDYFALASHFDHLLRIVLQNRQGRPLDIDIDPSLAWVLNPKVRKRVSTQVWRGCSAQRLESV